MPVPPLAANVAEYAVPTAPFGRLIVVTVSGFTTTIEKLPLVPVSPDASVAFTVTMLVPAAIGVPVIAPALDKLNPAGNVPLPNTYVSVPAPPVAATVAAYAVPTVPPANVVVENTIAGAAAIAIENVAVAVSAGDPVSVNVTVKLGLPAAVGVPVIAPVEPLRLSPAGNAPDVTVHVYGAIPPAAASVTEYAIPTIPPAKSPAAVLIAGFTGTLSDAVADRLVSVTEVAVTVTVNAVPTVAGAVYITPVVVELDSAPQAEPVHPVPLTVHVTPAFVESFWTAAVKLAESPGSTLLLAGP
jgi:hypothetical protein